MRQSDVRISNVTPEEFRDYLINEEGYSMEETIDQLMLESLRARWRSNPIERDDLRTLIDALEDASDGGENDDLDVVVGVEGQVVTITNWQITSYNGRRVVALNWDD